MEDGQLLGKATLATLLLVTQLLLTSIFVCSFALKPKAGTVFHHKLCCSQPINSITTSSGKKLYKMLSEKTQCSNVFFALLGRILFVGRVYSYACVSVTGTTILQGIQQTVGGSSEIVYKAVPDKNFAKGKGFDYAIVVIGEVPYAEFVGDNNNLTIPDPGIETVEYTCKAVKCVVVMISGRPLVVPPYLLQSMDAFVAAWLPGTEGQGIADVLYGDYDFTGKLSHTWFKSVDQLPMNVGDPYYDPLFPFGFGLKMGLKNR